jgi:hypothetical protein
MKKIGVMEYWSNGKKRNDSVFKSHHSNTPCIEGGAYVEEF